MITWSRHSRRIDPIERSTYPFCHGDRGAMGRSRMPIARSRRVNASPKAPSLSRMRKPGTVSQGKASVIWRASHSAVGLVVTPIHRRQRRPSPKMTNTNSRSNASVGTMRKSTDAIPSAWLRRKVFQHVFRNRRLGHLEAELEQLTMNTRRAPKRIFLAHTAHEISGFLINPGPAAWIVRFPAPPGAKTHPVPANDCLRTHDRS